MKWDYNILNPIPVRKGFKVMADEISRETASGWRLHGEYLILFGMLFLQLIYNVLTGVRLFTPEPVPDRLN